MATQTELAATQGELAATRGELPATQGELAATRTELAATKSLVAPAYEAALSWEPVVGTSSTDSGYGLGDGSVYITGTRLVAWNQTNAGGRDIALIKFNSGGTKLWTRLVGTSRLPLTSAMGWR